MKNKKEIAIVALTTGLALASVTPYGVGYAEETVQMQVDVQEDSFRTGELTHAHQLKNFHYPQVTKKRYSF